MRLLVDFLVVDTWRTSVCPVVDERDYIGHQDSAPQIVKTAILLALAALAYAGQTPAQLQPDPPSSCASCAEWNAPRRPFHIFGNTHFVGVSGLSSLLITSDQGHVLVDGGLPQTAPLIDNNIRTLGFRPEDIRLILASHEHYDHVGGIAAFARFTGAVVAAGAPAPTALMRGEPLADDPQFAFGRAANGYPAVARVRPVSDGEVLRVGPIAVTAHATPGHTPGSTTWTWRSCEAARCVDVVYADSLNAVSAPAFRFTGSASTPSRVAAFRQSIAKVAALPCDIIVSVHPGFTNLDGKIARRALQPAQDPFVDPQGCRAYAAAASASLDARVASESGR
jgi:metallo-beta-lactamase class B